MRKDVVVTRTAQPVPTEAWTDTTGPEVRHLVEAAESSQGRDSIGHQAVATLLSRGFPDALLVPPEALEAFREAHARRLLWVPFLIHFVPVALGVVLAVGILVHSLLADGWPKHPRGQFVLVECGVAYSRGELLGAMAFSLFGAAWIALGALAAFAAPGSRHRRTAATLLVLGWVAVVAFLAPEVVSTHERIHDVGAAIRSAFGAAWLVVPLVLAYGSLRGHR